MKRRILIVVLLLIGAAAVVVAALWNPSTDGIDVTVLSGGWHGVRIGSPCNLAPACRRKADDIAHAAAPQKKSKPKRLMWALIV